ncbi:glycosyltransferase family 4 protein [Sphingomonas immobilis]|uniref:Glycosyltransferase family 4 protein n=1 Tax=Sphingomonas immobilis TaxID=3063997 RepID=A0ABT9A477_9SPHN|nr:glycosyltransferase family 4 protein [Sphingomonas sp. CA1-15]MDO7844615.1 glycosyltransferase family 4 protein [Sphingomonas sp. CA1-15]
MRILLSLHHRLDPNAGAARVIIRLRDEMRALGHEVDTFSFDDLPSWLPAKAQPGVFPLFFARHIAGNRGRWDVIDASSGDGWLAYRGARRAGMPLRVTHSHGIEHLVARAEREEAAREGRTIALHKRLRRHGLRLAEVGRSFRNADLAMALNAAEAGFMQAELGISPAKIGVARLAVDDAIVAAPLAEPDPGAPFEAVQIGSYIARKGIAHTAAAMTAVMRRHPDVRLRFLGTLCDAAKVHADYPPDLHDRIAVVPRFANGALPDLLAGGTVQLMPSLFEGYGIVKLEAMARGLIPVVSDDGGTRTDVEDGVNGLVVPVADDAAMEAAIERLIGDPALRVRLRNNALATAANSSWRRVAAERLNLYEMAR